MPRIFRFAFVVVLPTAALRGTAAAEITFPLNDNNAGVFDQPNATLNGNTVYVAFIGDTTGSGILRVFFSAGDGARLPPHLLLPRGRGGHPPLFRPPPPQDRDADGYRGGHPFPGAAHPLGCRLPAVHRPGGPLGQHRDAGLGAPDRGLPP